MNLSYITDKLYTVYFNGVVNKQMLILSYKPKFYPLKLLPKRNQMYGGNPTIRKHASGDIICDPICKNRTYVIAHL